MSSLGALGVLVQALAEDRRVTTETGVDAVKVRAHGLAPLAFTHGLVEFRADYALSAIRADQQRLIASEAVDALAKVDVQTMLLKGISYAGWLYADPAERPMSDVDLLVRQRDYGRAADALERLGYRHAGPAIQRSARHHAMTFKRPNAAVDLHRSPTQLGRVAIPMDAVWSRSRPASWLPGAYRLDETDDFLFHLANLARHDLIVPLSSFVDAGRMLRRFDARARGALQRTAARWRFERVLGVCLEAVEIACGWRTTRRWWMPSRQQLLDGRLPRRPVQIARKVMLVEGPRELAAYAHAVVDGWVTSWRAH